MSETRGRTAVVTGGGSGIGRALARALAAQGSSVVVADIRPECAESVAAEIEASGGSALPVACDVSDRASVDALRAQIRSELAAPSLLFANAGVTCLDRLTDMSPEHVEWIVSVDLLGVSHCLQAFLPDMLAARSGHVVATASMAGLVPDSVPFHAPYAAAKAGVIAMMLNLRAELVGTGVGCTVFCPGGVATRIAETPRYRPARFGGPGEGTLRPPEGFQLPRDVGYCSAEEAAARLLAGVRDDRPMVVTDASFREPFGEYVELTRTAFDEAAAFEAGERRGGPGR